MTICDKINEVGETLQENLNARGVSCTFGVGTGESTVLEMVEMVNSTNLKGSSDVNLKIGANRPYLLAGETTDVMVKLENGLCKPLKNKNVIVGQSVFRDGGVTNNHNTKWWATGTLNITTSTDGTLVKNENSSGYSLDYSYVTDNFPSSWADRENAVTCYHRPFVVEFDLVSVSSTSNVGLYLGDASANVHTYFYNLGLNVGHIRIEVSTTQVKCYLDETLVSTNNLSDSVTLSRVGFRINAGNNFKYKNFVVYENINGVTDEKGEFALYNISVTDDTTFTATYSSVSASCKVEYCLFVDYAVTSKHNTNYTVGNAITKTVGGNYTTLSSTNSNSTTGRTYSTSSFSGDLTLEMEVNMVDYASTWAFYLGFRNGSNHSIARLLVGDWRYIKFTREDGVCKGYISTDNNTWSEMSMFSDDVGSSDVQLELYIYNATGTSHSVQFKNVRIKAL